MALTSSKNPVFSKIVFYCATATLFAGCGQDKTYIEGPQADGRNLIAPAPSLAPIVPVEGSLLPWQRSGKGPATDYYGGNLTSVQTGHFAAQVPDGKIPWSGYWYRLGETTTDDHGNQVSLFDSPLSKYDQWVKATHGETSTALAWDQDHRDGSSQAWEGECNAWAAASILYPEPLADPIHGKTVNGIIFTISDLKALVLKSYEILPPATLHRIGLPYTGGPGDDYQDIYPDQFHRVLQEELFRKKQAFIIDEDPSYPVWNYPIYSADVTIVADPADIHVLHVSTWVVWADDDVAPGFIGTRAINRQYTYDLNGVMKTAADGSQAFEVHAGSWTGGSWKDHPDFATVITDHARGESMNPQLKSAYIDEILK